MDFLRLLRRAEEIARKKILFHCKGNGTFLSENPGTVCTTANSPSLEAFKQNSGNSLFLGNSVLIGVP